MIAVDWSKPARGPEVCYTVAVLNSRHVASCVAQMVRSVVAYSAGGESVHVIGASMGAHLAGYVADRLRPYRLDRITGEARN